MYLVLAGTYIGLSSEPGLLGKIVAPLEDLTLNGLVHSRRFSEEVHEAPVSAQALTQEDKA